ncbi:MAG: DUF4350 domain-containing protein [Kineosporiaceae bacterium]
MSATLAAPPTSLAPAPGGRPRRSRLRSRAGLALLAVLLVLVAGLVALAEASRPVRPALDPADPGPQGALGVVQTLRSRGLTVREVHSAADLPLDASTTVVVTAPRTLSPAALDRLASGAGPLVLLVPDGPALRRLAPGVEEADPVEDPEGPLVSPRCDDPDAKAAGTVTTFEGLAYTARTGSGPGTADSRTRQCYRIDPDGGPARQEALASGGARRHDLVAATGQAAEVQAAAADDEPPAALLVRTRLGQRPVDVVGMSDVFSNDLVEESGNAAIALRLAGRTSSVAWYVPQRGDLGGAGDTTLFGLVPGPVARALAYLPVIAIVLLLWAGRRDARLVTEPLPVVVRASETELGRARLYVRAGARDRSAALLRTAALRRLAARLDVPPTASPDLVVSMVAQVSGRPTASVHDLLLGPAPGDDSALVRLARDLDGLEADVGGRR